MKESRYQPGQIIRLSEECECQKKMHQTGKHSSLNQTHSEQIHNSNIRESEVENQDEDHVQRQEAVETCHDVLE